ncbi:polysaccharide deacetylase family protein [Panacibacter ginsenosidivorans]|uniref:Polysaccharide deacetylase family protein n=1 Tax=Panacibacter ginsenosidivorans TaxID=1813871 RepID=A0A5B8V6P4_9BACT|nr:polysaccharide deacetylase family protein [Panacibacter ginsenosidivorans]QEC66421.1 polysaccharide deacetylase family protein [Panacibacter ginsenosidivorans]
MFKSIFFGNQATILLLCGLIGLFDGCTNQQNNSKNDIAIDTLPLKKVDTAKVIYLTFDDGPLNGTEGILDALDKEKIPATMFMVGRHMKADTEMKNKFEMAYNDNLLEVANHSFSHANNHYEAYYKDPQKVLEDFNKNQELLNFKDKDARMPGRNTWRIGTRGKDDISANGREAADLLHKNGYNLFGWDLEWQHSAGGKPVQTVQQMFEEIEKRINDPQRCFTPNHFVLLSHDEMFRKPWEVSELKQLVDLLKAKGYEFDHTDNYPGK